MHHDGGLDVNAAGADVRDESRLRILAGAHLHTEIAWHEDELPALVLGNLERQELDESSLDVLPTRAQVGGGEPARPRPDLLDVLELVDELFELLALPPRDLSHPPIV